jgi:hypothetical protein
MEQRTIHTSDYIATHTPAYLGMNTCSMTHLMGIISAQNFESNARKPEGYCVNIVEEYFPFENDETRLQTVFGHKSHTVCT